MMSSTSAFEYIATRAPGLFENALELADTISRDPRIASLLPPAAIAVQCTLFGKSPANNWLVAFHQDQSIPAAVRVASEHCDGWAAESSDRSAASEFRVLVFTARVQLWLAYTDGNVLDERYSARFGPETGMRRCRHPPE